MSLVFQSVRFYSQVICPVCVAKFHVEPTARTGSGAEPRQSEAFFLSGPERGKRFALRRRSARAAAQRSRRCPPLAPGGGNGKGGESDTLLPQAAFSCY